MIGSGRLNPGQLKLDLFCKGLRIDESCDLGSDARHVIRTRGGLGSGLDFVLPKGVWVNAPVTEGFAALSPYVMGREDGGYSVTDDRTGVVYPIAMLPQPEWYEETDHHRCAHAADRCHAGQLSGRLSDECLRVLAGGATVPFLLGGA